MESIGGRLAGAREKRGLSIEDVEFETHIRANVLRDLEVDEYANFANLTYARSFLALYSDYLNVDTSAFQAEFAKPELGSVEDYAYLQEPTEVLRGGQGVGAGGSSTKSGGGNATGSAMNGARKEKNPGNKGRNESARKDPSRRRVEQAPMARPHPILLVLATIGILAAIGYIWKRGKEGSLANQPTPRVQAEADSPSPEVVVPDPGATPIENPSVGDSAGVGTGGAELGTPEGTQPANEAGANPAAASSDPRIDTTPPSVPNTTNVRAPDAVMLPEGAILPKPVESPPSSGNSDTLPTMTPEEVLAPRPPVRTTPPSNRGAAITNANGEAVGAGDAEPIPRALPFEG